MNAVDVPVVLSFAGTDPSGGAGVQADIEALSSMGCHACPVVTAVTVQDTNNVLGLTPLDGELVMQQARALLEDIPVQAIKISLLPSVDIIEAIHVVLNDYPDIPVILDPILKAGGGAELTVEDCRSALCELLLPQTTLITPNSQEARALAPESDTLDASAMCLLDHGAEFVLITGSHEATETVNNTLYGNRRRLESFSWPRLPHHYHGSGCTLAAACAGLIAQGQYIPAAVHEAQEYAWQTLEKGFRIGMGQYIPNRLFWANGESA